MKYSVFSLIMLMACASDYKGLQSVQSTPCFDHLSFPDVSNAWYSTSVDVVGKHLSGLLFIKEMQDSSRRVVFTNEAGLTFFDFGFHADGRFTTYKIIDQMDKKVVVDLLRNDFSLILGLPFHEKQGKVFEYNGERYSVVGEKRESGYFITDTECASLHRVEMGSDKKRKTTAWFFGSSQQPDSIRLQHHTFDMQIRLKKLNR